MPWSPSAAQAGCLPPRSPTSSASGRSSRRPTPAISAPSACTSPTSAATISAPWSAGSPPPTRRRSRRLERAGGDRRRRHRRGRHSEREGRRSTASPTSAISARVTRSRSTSPRSSRALPRSPHMWKDFHRVHDRNFGFHYEGKQDVELVNLRVQAVGMQHRPALKPDASRASEPARPFAHPPGLLARRPAGSSARSTDRSELGLGQRDRRAGDRRGIRLDRRGAGELDAPPDGYAQSHCREGGLRPSMLDRASAATKLGPIELEVIHGTIRAAELEIEAAVERTARSPMIRDQHDYRVALFDAKGRKLTGRSYSAIVEPVFAYFGRRHPARRRVLLERSLQFLRRHRPRARPLHDRADILRRAADRLQPGLRPS